MAPIMRVWIVVLLRATMKVSILLATGAIATKRLEVGWQLEVDGALNIAGADIANDTARFLLIERETTDKKLK